MKLDNVVIKVTKGFIMRLRFFGFCGTFNSVNNYYCIKPLFVAKLEPD